MRRSGQVFGDRPQRQLRLHPVARDHRQTRTRLRRGSPARGWLRSHAAQARSMVGVQADWANSGQLARVTRGQQGSLASTASRRSASIVSENRTIPKLVVRVRFSSPASCWSGDDLQNSLCEGSPPPRLPRVEVSLFDACRSTALLVGTLDQQEFSLVLICHELDRKASICSGREKSSPQSGHVVRPKR